MVIAGLLVALVLGILIGGLAMNWAWTETFKVLIERGIIR
jgi:hypothetical protein